MPKNVQDRAAFTYNAAADFYDASPLSFWDYFGRRTIELASLSSGSRVLDVCCGAGFDAIVCVFGIFFVPDMANAVSELWSRIRPGGKLAVTTWGPKFCEPANAAFWCSVKNVRPDLYKGFNPWDRINDPAGLRKILDEGGVASPSIITENRLHRIKSPEDWWTIVLGSGYRGTIEQLTATERQKVKAANLTFIYDENISAIETNALYALATKPETANFQ